MSRGGVRPRWKSRRLASSGLSFIFGDRLTVGRWVLTPVMEVRILLPDLVLESVPS